MASQIPEENPLWGARHGADPPAPPAQGTAPRGHLTWGESGPDQPQRVMVFQHFNYKAVGENSMSDVQQEIELQKRVRHIPTRLP